MALPKYNYNLFENDKSSSKTQSEKELKSLVNLYIHKINDTLKQPDKAKKAALIIEELLKNSK